MSVTIDDQPFAAESLGLRTVGQVLSHLRRRHRLVVNLKIDGHDPNLEQIESLYAQPLGQRTVFIETVEPQQIANEVFDSVETLLDDAEALREQVVGHLQTGEHADALKKLGSCFTTWSHTLQSVEKVAKLLRVNLEEIHLDKGSLGKWLIEFSGQLGEIRSALESRDYVALSDILSYEVHDASDRWRQSLNAIRKSI